MSRNAILLFFTLVFLPFSFLFSQQYNFRRYSIEEGLPRSGVYSIIQDREGFLWIATEEGGLTRFDGKDFTTYTTKHGITSNIVRCLHEDVNGNIWMGTHKGLTVFDGTRFYGYYGKKGFPEVEIRSIESDRKGNVWIGTLGEGVFKVENTNALEDLSFKKYDAEQGLLSPKCRVILKDSKGRVWFGTDKGINRFDGKRFETIEGQDTLADRRILCMFEDNDRNMWFGTRGGVIKYNKGNLTTFSVADGLVQNRVRAITEDLQGNIWLGTRKGISIFDGTDFKTITEKNGLSNNRIRCIYKDNSGNLWVATYFGGVNKYRGNAFITYKEQDGIDNNQIFSVCQDSKEDIWLGTFEGITKLEMERDKVLTIHNFGDREGLAEKQVHSILPANNIIWAAHNGGIDFLKNGRFQKVPKLEEEILALESDGKKTLFAISSETLYEIHTSTLKVQEIATTPSDFRSLYYAKDNTLWIGAEDGLYRYQNGTFQKPLLDKALSFVNSITEDRYHNLWVGTQNDGIFFYDIAQNRLIHYGKKQGLASDNVFLIVFDDQHDLWAGYERGVDRLRLQKDGKIEDVSYFGKEEGFIGIESNRNAAIRDTRGNIWFGTVKGITRFNPYAVHENKEEPFIHITNVLLGGEEIDWETSPYAAGAHTWFAIPEELSLPYNQNNIQFEFKGINLSVPGKVKYQYKLDGYDEKWSHTGESEQVSYTNLPSGNYSFMVKASNEHGIWNKYPATISFTIKTPFWKQTWFITLAVILIFGSFFGVSQLRLYRLQRAKKKLQHEVNTRTAELQKEKERVERQNKEINIRKKELEGKNKSITDSINYAKKIQTAVMEARVDESHTPDDQSFIFYKPKDIVSGDFYWFKKVGDELIIVAADCTGHGVPGAFMSLIGITFLNQITTETPDIEPQDLLNELRHKVIQALNKESDSNHKDGMDLALIKVNWKTNTLQYAGANNPVYIVRHGKLDFIKANKMPIGIHDYENLPFTCHERSIEKGNMIYLFSDGYVDQFGGPVGKKFMSKNFKLLLEKISDEPLAEQRAELEKQFNTWKADEDQVDDVLVIGLRI